MDSSSSFDINRSRRPEEFHLLITIELGAIQGCRAVNVEVLS